MSDTSTTNTLNDIEAVIEEYIDIVTNGKLSQKERFYLSLVGTLLADIVNILTPELAKYIDISGFEENMDQSLHGMLSTAQGIKGMIESTKGPRTSS